MKRTLVVILLLALIGYATWSFTGGGIFHTLLRTGIPSETRVERIQEYFNGWGVAAPIGYMLIVMVEVILAPIPGTLLYLPGGAIFGWFMGGLMSLLGNIAGAGVACQIMRSLGRSYLEPYLDRGALKKYEMVLERRGIWIVFLLRVNPLTSSDIVSYAAGLTRLPVWKVMTGTMLGMAPLCFLQAYFAQEIFTSFPWLIYPLIIAGIVYAFVVIKVVRGLIELKNEPAALSVYEEKD